ncbi:TPA: sugar transferase [Candidatus Saccharibacteria bacterium]|nr:sugar transferase [Candidatus Saccharibacteria bacterium]HIO87866.1 sugar transferase [Candidatus Saccharibacteria bacterium]
MTNSKTRYALLLILSDFLTIIAAFVVAYIARVSLDSRPLVEQITSVEYLRIFLLLLPFWVLIFASLGLYNSKIYSNRFSEAWRLLLGSFLGILFIIGYDFVSDTPIFPARLVAVYGFVLGAGLLVLERQIVWQIKKWGYRHGRGLDRVMLIGNAPATKDLAKLLGHAETSGVDIKAIVGQKTNVPQGYSGRHFSSLTDALEAIETLNITTVIQTQLYESEHKNHAIQQAALNNHVEYKLMLAEADFYSGAVDVELFHYFPVIAVHPTPLLGWGRIVKRGFDTALAIVLIVLTAPIMLATALALAVFDNGPIIFKQKRVTRGGREYNVYKFRSFLAKYNGRDNKETFEELGRMDLYEEFVKNRGQLPNDPRVGSIGRFIRGWSIDELPQLFNVIKGDISLVGPRTISRADAEQSFRDKTPLILSVKTGITGLAQVSGRTFIPVEERVKLDLFYVQNWSLWLDIKILFKTIWVVLKREDAV